MKDYVVRTITKKTGQKIYHKYFTKQGDEIKDKDKIEEISSGLYIPPAYDNVQINKKKNAKVLAIGYDEKGRPQYIYHKEHIEKQKNKKYDYMKVFGKKFPTINHVINRDINLPENSKDKQIAVILKLIMECHFRVGNDRYFKENKSYGTTTLEKQHIVEKDNHVVIDFIGKKKVRNVCKVTNKKLVKTLKQKKKRKSKTNRIFTYKQGRKETTIKPQDVNKYLKQFGKFTTKNFRTWGANIEFITKLIKHSKDKSFKKESEIKQVIKQSIEDVACKLHNTPSVCRSNYIDPEIINFFSFGPDKFLSFFKVKGGLTKEKVQKKYLQFLEEIS